MQSAAESEVHGQGMRVCKEYRSLEYMLWKLDQDDQRVTLTVCR